MAARRGPRSGCRSRLAASGHRGAWVRSHPPRNEGTHGAASPRVPRPGRVRHGARLHGHVGLLRRAGRRPGPRHPSSRTPATHPTSALQTEYSLWSRDPEDEILPTCRELGIGFVAYSPLGRGFLSGQIRRYEDLAPDDWRRSNPRFQGENFTRNLELVARIA